MSVEYDNVIEKLIIFYDEKIQTLYGSKNTKGFQTELYAMMAILHLINPTSRFAPDLWFGESSPGETD